MIEMIRGVIKIVVWTVVAVAAVALTVYTIMAVQALRRFEQNFELAVRTGSKEQKERARELHKARKDNVASRWVIMHYRRVNISLKMASLAGDIRVLETKEV